MPDTPVWANDLALPKKTVFLPYTPSIRARLVGLQSSLADLLREIEGEPVEAVEPCEVIRHG